MAFFIRGNPISLVCFFFCFISIVSVFIWVSNREKKAEKNHWICLIYLDEAECELNCKPIGMNYFAMLKERVIDGTSCWFPVDFVRQNHSGRGMCVEGTCKVRADFSLIKFYGAIVFYLGIYKTKKQKKIRKTKTKYGNHQFDMQA